MKSGSCGEAGLEGPQEVVESTFLLWARSKGKSVLIGGDLYCLKKMPVQEIKTPSSLVYTYHSKVSLNIKSESKLQIEAASSCPASLEQENNRPLSAVNNLLHIRGR